MRDGVHVCCIVVYPETEGEHVREQHRLCLGCHFGPIQTYETKVRENERE